MLAARPAASRPGARRTASPAEQRAVDQLDLLIVEAIGEHLVRDHRVHRTSGDLLHARSEVDRLADRQLGRRADEHDGAAVRVAEERPHRRGLVAERSLDAEMAERGTRLDQRDRVARRRGRTPRHVLPTTRWRG
jgi:hypothetical protein